MDLTLEKKLEMAQKSLDEDAYSRFLGIEILSLSEEKIVARIPFKKELLNPYRTLHGGVIYSVADIVCGTFACSCGYFCTTVTGNMNYLEPGICDEYLYCEGTLVRRGAHLIVIDAVMKSDRGRIVDTGTFTFFKSSTSMESLKEK